MVLNIRLGTDIVYVPRIADLLERFGHRFLQRVYTVTEQQDCCKSFPTDSHFLVSSDRMNQKMVNQLAGRWAAKEAVAKVLGTGWQGVRYTDIEIQRQPSGQPQVCLYATAAAQVEAWGNCQWQLSLSHDGDYAIATAIAFCPS